MDGRAGGKRRINTYHIQVQISYDDRYHYEQLNYTNKVYFKKQDRKFPDDLSACLSLRSVEKQSNDFPKVILKIDAQAKALWFWKLSKKF